MIESRTTASLPELVAIWADPQVRALARRRSGDPDVAEDALQEAYLSVARLLGRRHIPNLRSFFCRVLITQISRMQHSAAAVRLEDAADLSDRNQRPALARDGTAAGGFESESVGRLYVEGLLAELRRSRSELMTSVPGRSADPDRYRQVIFEAAEAMLRNAGERLRYADLAAVFMPSYPEWFAPADVTQNTSHQRLSRARGDTRVLLRLLLQEEPPPGISPAREDSNRGAARRPGTVDDTLRALFLESEQVQLPQDAPFDVGRELAVFTEWLDGQIPARAGRPARG